MSEKGLSNFAWMLIYVVTKCGAFNVYSSAAIADFKGRDQSAYIVSVVAAFCK